MTAPPIIDRDPGDETCPAVVCCNYPHAPCECVCPTTGEYRDACDEDGHAQRYEDGDYSTGTAADYEDWLSEEDEHFGPTPDQLAYLADGEYDDLGRYA